MKPKTVTQRLNALEQKLASDLEAFPRTRLAVCHERIASLERRVEDRIHRGQIWNHKFKHLEEKVRTFGRGAQMLHDEDSRFSKRVLDAVREPLKDLERRVGNLDVGMRMFNDDNSRFSKRVLNVVRQAKAKRRSNFCEGAGCVAGFLGVVILTICAIYGAGSIAEMAWKAVTS